MEETKKSASKKILYANNQKKMSSRASSAVLQPPLPACRIRTLPSAEPQRRRKRTSTHQGGASTCLPEASVGAGPSCLAGGGRRMWGQKTLARREDG